MAYFMQAHAYPMMALVVPFVLGRPLLSIPAASPNRSAADFAARSATTRNFATVSAGAGRLTSLQIARFDCTQTHS